KENAKKPSRGTPRTAPPSFGPIPKSCSTYSGNRAIGCTLLLAANFGLDQMPCLDKMWTRESNWRTTADNPSSHSYGIPQALPASKMAAFGSDYRTNPATQIKWGLHYIVGRYKTPCGAWTFWQAHNWY
ncbi:MAG TPA: lytic transglycosylase domain-containing protein, partial [Micromonosporaceae bacterium]